MTDSAPLPTEIIVLAFSVVLLLAHIFLQGGLATRDWGLAHNAGPRDEETPAPSKIAGRAKRALDNYLETWPAFLALALALTATGRAGGIGSIGAMVWLAARCAYLPLYLAGVPYLRSFVWAASLGGLGLMFAKLVF